MKLTIIKKEEIPQGECTTVGAIMPRILCVISGEKANVYKGNTCVRKFLHFENAILKLNKLCKAEQALALKILKKISDNKPLLISKRNVLTATEKTS